MPAPPRRGPLMEAVWKIHKFVWRVSGGRLGGRAAGMPVLELTTTGRRSGKPRSVLLNYLQEGVAYVVIGSHLGEDSPPAWLLNLEAHPDATIRLRHEHASVTARVAAGDERERLWRRAVEANADYEEYQSRTARVIPVVVLEPDE